MKCLTQQLIPDGLEFEYQKKNFKLLVQTRDEYIFHLGVGKYLYPSRSSYKSNIRARWITREELRQATSCKVVGIVNRQIKDNEATQRLTIARSYSHLNIGKMKKAALLKPRDQWRLQPQTDTVIFGVTA